MTGVRILLNNRGFSLPTVLMSAAIGGTVLLGTISTVKLLSKTTKNAETFLTRSQLHSYLLTSTDCAASEAANKARFSQTEENGGCTAANVLARAPMQLVNFSGSEVATHNTAGTQFGRFTIRVECGNLVEVLPATVPPTYRYNGYVIRATQMKRYDLTSTNPADFYPGLGDLPITWTSPQTLLVPRGIASVPGFAGAGSGVEAAAICGPNDIARRITNLTNRVFLLEQQLEAVRADLQQKIDTLRADLTAVNADLQAYKGSNNAEVDALKARATALEARVAQMDNNLRGGNAHDYPSSLQITTLRADIDRLRTDVDTILDPARISYGDRLTRIEGALDAVSNCSNMGAYYAVGSINRASSNGTCKRLPVPGDFNNDGFSDIVTGAMAGGGPHVRVFTGNPSIPYVNNAPQEITGGFYAYEEYFRGGTSVGWGDFNGDGLSDIITGAGPGGGPRVRVFRSPQGFYAPVIHDFFGYDVIFNGGVNAN